MDLHKLASLLVRDNTIIAKRLYDLARDFTAITGTWRQVLDDSQPVMLQELSRENGMVAAPPIGSEESAYQSSFEELA